MIDNANNECHKGCNLGKTICQGGFYCIDGSMMPCPAGTYRTPTTNITSVFDPGYASQCTPCPYGSYRSTPEGVYVTDCALCPVGKYSNAIGQTSITACQDCPAGQFTSQSGSRFCQCITADSCDMAVTLGGETVDYYKDGIDYFRESVPYVGR